MLWLQARTNADYIPNAYCFWFRLGLCICCQLRHTFVASLYTLELRQQDHHRRTRADDAHKVGAMGFLDGPTQSFGNSCLILLHQALP